MAVGAVPVYAAVPQPHIRPRASWAGTSLPPKGIIDVEHMSDVRFLLLHHTQTPNGETGDRVAARIRSMYNYHTSSAKGWPDVAYNFLVAADGSIWEGRQGSLAKPVKGDATGGSQGFAQLCTFIGDHTKEPPTAAAMASMASLLAWLADRYQISLAADHQVSFISRGSTRWKKGTQVTTEPIAGHRDMSVTSCPGDALYPLIRSELWPRARAIVEASSSTSNAQGARSVGSVEPSAVAPGVEPTSAVNRPQPGSALDSTGPVAAALTGAGLAAGVGAAWWMLKDKL